MGWRSGLFALIVVGWLGAAIGLGCVGDDPVDVTRTSDDASSVTVDATPAFADQATNNETSVEASVTGCAAYAALTTGESLCDDFDGAEVSPLWFKQGDRDAGVSIGGPGKSAPNALAVTVTGAVPAGPYYWAKIAGKNRTKARVELDLRFDALGLESDPRVGLIALAPAGTMGLGGVPHLRIEVQQDKLVLVSVDANALSDNLIVGLSLVANLWVHVSLVVDHQSNQVTFEIDGTPISTVGLPVGFPGLGAATAVAVGVLYTSNLNSTWAVRYDNVGLFLQ